MSEDFYAEKLAWFKENEKPESVLLVADDPNLIKIIVAWTNTKVTHTDKLGHPRGDSENEVWEWLWSTALYSREELIARSGHPRVCLREKDGTVNR